MQKRFIFTTKQLTKMGLLLAMAVVLKSFLSFETGSFRFTFYEIPVMVIGILFGPIIGGVLGFVNDVLHMMFSPFAYSFNVFTLSNMVWAIVPGVLLFRKKITIKKVLISVIIAGSMAFVLNTIGIKHFRGIGEMYATLPYRFLVLLIKIPFDTYLINTIYQRVLVSELRLLKR